MRDGQGAYSFPRLVASGFDRNSFKTRTRSDGIASLSGARTTTKERIYDGAFRNITAFAAG